MSQMDPLMEVFLYENSQLLEQLEEMFLSGEENHYLSKDNINEVFRIMHTIKGSSSIMSFDSMAKLAHRLEDLFSSVREQEPPAQMWSSIFDIVLEAIDYFKAQMLVRLFDDPAKAGGHFPRPFGVFYEEDRACYEDLMAMQIEETIATKGKGNLDKLLRGKEVWEIV